MCFYLYVMNKEFTRESLHAIEYYPKILVIAVNWLSGYRKMVVTAVETIFGLPENGCDRSRNHFRVTGKWL